MFVYTKVHPLSWNGSQASIGDCIGVFWRPGGNAIPIGNEWNSYSFQTISKAEYETLVEFGMPVLDIPCIMMTEIK